MRLPTRKAEQLNATKVSDDNYLTPDAIERMKRTLKRLIEQDRLEAAAEVRRTGEYGDFSENAEYQAAKGKLRGINNRILLLQEKLKRAIPIQSGSTDGVIRLGSVVRLKVDDNEAVWHLVGVQEADPPRGRISYLSPIGQLLLGKREGESVETTVRDSTRTYTILRVQ
jgi:transcription elongation GreA/GreB family factor